MLKGWEDYIVILHLKEMEVERREKKDRRKEGNGKQAWHNVDNC